MTTKRAFSEDDTIEPRDPPRKRSKGGGRAPNEDVDGDVDGDVHVKEDMDIDGYVDNDSESGSSRAAEREPTEAEEDVDGDVEGDEDVDDDDDDDDDDDGSNPTQQELEALKRRKPVDQAYGEIGVIESIRMENIMCHSLLEINLHSNLNFIIGQNGSGKSAILTALLTAFGAKTSFTGRGSSIKDIIKNGEKNAVLRIKVRNLGRDAYKPEIYGESITIERKIGVDSSGGYKIENSRNKTVSSKKDELIAVLDHFNMQIDNPLNFLTQDTARQFLARSNPEDIYKMFFKGTGLEALLSDYQEMKQYKNEITAKLSVAAENLKDLRATRKEWSEKYKALKEAQVCQQDLLRLQAEFTWAVVIEQEHSVEKMEAAKDRVSHKVTKSASKVAEQEQLISDLEPRVAELQLLSQTKEAEGRELEKNLAANKEERRENQKKIDSLGTEEDQLNRQMVGLHREIEDIEKRINEECRKNQDYDASLRDRKEAEIKDLRNQSAERNAAKVAIENDIRAKDKQLTSSCGEKLDIEANLKRESEHIKQISTNIRQLEEQGNNRFKAFGGNNVIPLLRAIEGHQWRGNVPIGPFGIHLKVKPEFSRWSNVIDSVLGLSLNGYGVTHQDDLKVLQKMLSDHRLNFPIFRYNPGGPFNFTSGLPEQSREFVTILDAITVADPTVLQQLIVNNHIEQIALVDERDAAERLARKMPRNLRSCYTLNGYQVGDRTGAMRSQLLNWWTPQRLREDVQTLLDDKKTDLYRAERKRDDFLAHIRRLEAQGNELDIQKLAQKRTLMGVDGEIIELNERVDILRAQLIFEQPSQIGNLEGEKQSAERKTELIKVMFDDITRTKESLVKLKADLEKVYASSRTERDNLLRHADKYKSDYNEKRENLARLVHNRTHYLAKHSEYERTLSEHKIAVSAFHTRLTEDIDRAEALYSRVEPSADKNAIEKQMDKLQSQLSVIEREHGRLEEVMARFNRAREEYKAANLTHSQESRILDIMNVGIRRRSNLWHEFRAAIATRAKLSFAWNLLQRGYKGTMKFNHDLKKIFIRVTVENPKLAKAYAGAPAKNKDPRSLSGGEKSFSTICLLLALWDMMASPVRCLDEFDVFMDPVNRRIAMKMIIESCRDSQGMQYILITPQDMSHVQGVQPNEMKVHRLRDPERGQMRLNFVGNAASANNGEDENED